MDNNILTRHLDKIHLVDCLELLKKLPTNSVDLIVSSPPYNIGKEYEVKRALEIYLEEQSNVLKECVRVLKATGSLFWQVGAYSNKGTLIPLDIKFFPILESLEMKPRNRIIWARQHGLHAQNKFSCRHETILWFTKSDNYKFNLDNVRVPQKYQNKKAYRGVNKGNFSCNPQGKNPGDIWLFRNVKHNHEEQTIHPAQFPEDLIARIVLSTTNDEDIVLDPYIGVGTVAVVARDYNRHFLGAELEKKYYDVSLRRIAGLPDSNNKFPNLKTLREYVERTNEPIGKFSFDTQVGNVPTDESKSKIYSEGHHLNELYARLNFEESSFSARINNVDLPDDNGFVHKAKPNKKSADQSTLF